MRNLLTVTGGLLAAWLLFAPAPARADAGVNLSVCNGYGGTIFLALAWQDQQGWHSTGWWTIDDGKCQVEPITSSQFYYHWETEQETNCICPPPIANPQEKGGIMLGETDNAFNLSQADQPQGDAHLAWFNPVLLTVKGGDPADFTGVEKLLVGQNGVEQKTLYVHQASAVNPLP